MEVESIAKVKLSDKKKVDREKSFVCENLTLYRSCDTGSAEDKQRKKEEGKTAEKKSKFEDKAQDSRRSIEQHKKRNITHSSLRRESVSNKTTKKPQDSVSSRRQE